MTSPVRVSSSSRGITQPPGSSESPSEWQEKLKNAVGTTDTEIARYTVKALSLGIQGKDEAALNALLAQVQEMEPRNAVERCLLIQMMLVSHKAISALGKSSSIFGNGEEDAASAMRFMRLYLQQVEAFRKLRGGGQQTITINHVSANQAVVGDVYRQ